MPGLFDIAGRTACVTGASFGLGRRAAVALAGAGARVVGLARRGAARATRNAAQTCIGRNGDPEDIDGPLLFLCSEGSACVSGQVLMVDGEVTAR